MLVRKMYDCFRQTGEVKADSIPPFIVKSIKDIGYTKELDKELIESIVGLSKLAKTSTFEQFDKNFEDELPALKLSAEQMHGLKGGAAMLKSGSDTCEGTCVT